MSKTIAIVLVLVVTIETTNGIRNKQVTSNVTQTLDYLLASNRYDKRLRPGFGGSPVTISVNFFIKSMGPVSDNDQSFGLDCYFRQHWYDLRLKYQKLPGLEEFSMSWLFLDRVWKPDTYFVNGKKSFLHRITVPNKFLRLRHDGFITYSTRLTITASCPMYLRKFPLDTQRCPLVLGSYGYTNKDIIYKWTDASPIGLQEGVEIAQFDLANITTEDEKIITKGGLSYSTVQATFWLKRHTGYFMLQVYIPCGLVVVASWISFWIDPDAVYVPCGLIVLSSWVSFWIDPDDVAARVALGVTTVLSLTTLGFGGRAQLPKVPYWTALDWFVIICFTSVFSVMIEYAVINFADKFAKDLKKVIQSQEKEEKREEIKKEEKILTKKERSASFSYLPAKPKDEETETTVQIESRPFTIGKKLPRRLSKKVVAYLKTPTATKRSLSIPNLKLEMEKSEEEKDKRLSSPPSIVVTSFDEDEDLIDFESEVEPIDVVLDVSEEASEIEDGGKRKDLEEKEKAFGKFLKNFKEPKTLWEKFGIFPRQTILMKMIEKPEPPNKFSKIDVQSRKNFPIVFFISLIIYLFAFMFYLSDDFPLRDTDVSLYRQ